MIARKARVQPTYYPRVPFHSIRCAQLASSIVVSGILSYFVQQLHHDGAYIPWTYLLLLTVSALTVISLTTTIVLHCFTGLHPHSNMISNSILFLLWSVGFALFTWWSSGTLTHACNKRNWGSSIGIRICQYFKVLFTFTLLGLVSTTLATYLDYRVYRRSTQRGQYDQMQNPGTIQVIHGSSETHTSGAEYKRVHNGKDLAEKEDERAHLTERIY